VAVARSADREVFPEPADAFQAPACETGPMKSAKKDPRHRAREAALQILYQWELTQAPVAKAAETFFDFQWPDAQPASDMLRGFATALARETVEQLSEIDAVIADTAERWRPERMAIVDRLVLRLASCELRRGDTPPAVVIDEAIELARTFSSEESVKFINGMLDGIRKKLSEPR
jgi:transcription antitermination protein NusB